MSRFGAYTAVFLALCLLEGCYTPGGGWYPKSGGAVTFYSYETRPTTIQLIDLRTGESFFTMDLEPGKQLTFDFQKDKGDDPVLTPDLMRWQVWPIGTTTGTLTNSLTVPSADDRRVDVFYREGIEFRTAPPDRALRVDEMVDRPDWWTPEGGEMPPDTRGLTNYDR